MTSHASRLFWHDRRCKPCPRFAFLPPLTKQQWRRKKVLQCHEWWSGRGSIFVTASEQFFGLQRRVLSVESKHLSQTTSSFSWNLHRWSRRTAGNASLRSMLARMFGKLRSLNTCEREEIVTDKNHLKRLTRNIAVRLMNKKWHWDGNTARLQVFELTLTNFLQNWMLCQPLAKLRQRLGFPQFVFTKLNSSFLDKLLVHLTVLSRLWIEMN